MEDTNYQRQKGQCGERLFHAVGAAKETVEKMRSLPLTAEKIRKAKASARALSSI